MKKVELNKDYYLVRCSSIDVGANNAFAFDASDSWVIKKDNGEQFATRYTYSTKFSKKHKLYFDCGTAKAAIQQAIIQAYPNEKLKDIYFTVEYKNEPEADFDVMELEVGDAIWDEDSYKEIVKISVAGKINITFFDGTERLFNDNEKCIIQ